MFFGAFMLLVLPLGLITAAQMVKQTDFGKTGGGKVLEWFLYLIAAAGIATAVYLLTLI